MPSPLMNVAFDFSQKHSAISKAIAVRDEKNFKSAPGLSQPSPPKQKAGIQLDNAFIREEKILVLRFSQIDFSGAASGAVKVLSFKNEPIILCYINRLSGSGNRENISLDVVGFPLLWMENEATSADTDIKEDNAISNLSKTGIFNKVIGILERSEEWGVQTYCQAVDSTSVYLMIESGRTNLAQDAKATSTMHDWLEALLQTQNSEDQLAHLLITLLAILTFLARKPPPAVGGIDGPRDDPGDLDLVARCLANLAGISEDSSLLNYIYAENHLWRDFAIFSINGMGSGDAIPKLLRFSTSLKDSWYEVRSSSIQIYVDGQLTAVFLGMKGDTSEVKSLTIRRETQNLNRVNETV
ncbi:hypothetical protein B0H11DRAFT_1925589 [Mycena galericulata]|nr:hypothetical protein B0H11DRAFT_1925589 [Mycena galericulata]